MKNVLTVLIVMVMLVLVGGFVLAQSGNDLFQQALVKERAGSYQEAIKLYQAIVQKNNSDHKLVAKALFQIGQAYEKLDNAEALKAYERIARDFADQKDVAADAGRRLVALNTARPSADALAKRLVCTDCGDSHVDFDGRSLVFTDWDSGDLAIRDLASGQVRRLMAKSGSNKDSPAFAWLSVLSPDGRQVAYLWDAENPEHEFQLRTIVAEPGAKPRILLDNPDNQYYHPAGWSADSKSVLVAIQKSDHTWQLAWVASSDGSVKVLKSLQWRFQAVFQGNNVPRISPDGRYIAYSALASNPSNPPEPTDSQDQHIYILAADGSSETEVVKTSGFNWNPVWTPDGKHLLFLSNRTGNRSLWSIPIENGKATATPSLVSLSLGGGSIWPVGMTRAGSYHYAQWQGSLEEISIADIRGGKSSETFVGTRPAWSPDGRSIAFKRPHPGSEERQDGFDLVVHSLETGNEKTFPSALGVSEAGQPVWFHDGKGILTGLGRGRKFFGVYRADLEGGDWKPVQHTQTDVAPLSPDDRILYNFRPEGEPSNGSPIGYSIVAVDLATGAERQVLAHLPSIAALALSPDGRTLVFERKNPSTVRVYVSTVGVDGTNLRDVYTFDPGAAGGPLAWANDGRAILFAQQQGEKGQIMRIAAQGGKPEFTGIEAAGTIQTFDVSPDGQRIAYSSTKNQKDQVWALDNILKALK